MSPEKLNNPTKAGPKTKAKAKTKAKEGFLIVPHHFLREEVKVLGVGPALLYLELLSYSHKKEELIWPTLSTLSRNLGVSKNTLLSYREVLLKYGLLKKTARRKVSGKYPSICYQVTPLEELENSPAEAQILEGGRAKFAPEVVQNLPSNNNQMNNNQRTTTRTVVASDFKKKEKEKRQVTSPEETSAKKEAVRRKLAELAFEEDFIKKIFKEYSLEKIEEKLDLLLVKKNIKNPAGWLYAALKEDYQDSDSAFSSPREREEESEEESREAYGEESGKTGPLPAPPRISREKALEAIRLIKDNLFF